MTKRKLINILKNVIPMIVLIIIAILLMNSSKRSVTSLFSKICIFIIAALSLNLICGNLGELVLGHGGFLLVGFITAYFLTKGIFILVDKTMSSVEVNNLIYAIGSLKPLGYLICIASVIVGAIISGLVGFLVGLIVLGRLKGDYLAIVTLGIGLIFVKITENVVTPQALSVNTKIMGNPLLYVVFTILVMVFCVLFIKSRFGRGILAIRDDEIAAEASGIPVNKYKIMTFTIGAAIAGVAGVLYCFNSAQPASAFNHDLSIQLLLMIVLGGLGSYTGTVIAVPLLVIFNEYFLLLLPDEFGNNPKIFYGILLVAIMLFRPLGILGTKEFSWLWVKKVLYKLKIIKKNPEEAKESISLVNETTESNSSDESILLTNTNENLNEDILTINDLSITFGGLKAVEGFNINIKKGDLVGLIGPNGAGKTTIFNLITGIYKPTTGTINLNGNNISLYSPHNRVENGVARTFQNIRLFKRMTVLDNVKVAYNHHMKYSIFASIFHTKKQRKEEKELDIRAHEILKIFGLDEYANDEATNLAYGKQRKLEIARALISNPALLCLDEPAAGMNPSETEELMNTISLIRKKFGVTIFLIEHDMKLVMGICDWITVLNFGKTISSGTPKEISSNKDVIAAYLGD